MPQFTIDVDVPEGYEPVAYRPPRAREVYLRDGQATEATFTCERLSAVILRKKWEPAAWMPKGARLYRGCLGAWKFEKHGAPGNVDAVVLAALYGETFIPPPTSPVQL